MTCALPLSQSGTKATDIPRSQAGTQSQAPRSSAGANHSSSARLRPPQTPTVSGAYASNVDWVLPPTTGGTSLVISCAGATLSVLFRIRLGGSSAVRGSFAHAQPGKLAWGRGLASAPCLVGTEYLPAGASSRAHKRIVTGTQIFGSKSTPFTSLLCLQACVWRVNPEALSPAKLNPTRPRKTLV